MDKYPLEVKSEEELVEEANALLRKFRDSEEEMTWEEQMEDDVEGGYFEDD